MAKNRHFYGFFARFWAIFGVLQRTLTPSFVGSNPATPATDTIYCIRNIPPNTIYGFCFFCGFFLPFDCGVNCGVNCGVKKAFFIGYIRSFVLPARDTLASSPYSLCLPRKTLRLCRTSAPPKASPLRGCTLPPYIAYKKECMVNSRLVLRALCLSVCNRYECFWEQAGASGYCAPSLRRL